MSPIKSVVFDFGGVIVSLNRDHAVKKFLDLGVKDADSLIDKYHQKGVFLEVENGKIDAKVFCNRMSQYAGRELSFEEVQQAWLGFITEVPQYKLDYMRELKNKYKVYLLSNTNPFVMDWARSKTFTPAGRPLDDYLDKIYASYEMKVVKTNPVIFGKMIEDSGMLPSETLFVDDGSTNIQTAAELGFRTYLAENGEDWRENITSVLSGKGK